MRGIDIGCEECRRQRLTRAWSPVRAWVSRHCSPDPCLPFRALCSWTGSPSYLILCPTPPSGEPRTALTSWIQHTWPVLYLLLHPHWSQVWNVLLSSRTLQGEPLQGPCPLDLSTVPFTWGHFHHGCPLLLLLPPGAGNGAPSLPTLTQQLEAKPGPELAFRCESWPLGVSSGAHEARSEPCWGASAF